MRTIAYVDGFNLYFGAIRRTPHRWLNLQRLMELHLKPHHQIVGIKYFTAKLNPRPNDPDAPARQATYLRALAHLNRFDCAVIVSGDSDLLMPVKIIRNELHKVVGVLNPQVHPCTVLKANATFYKHLRPNFVAAAQFPQTLTDAHGTFTKPPT